MEYPPSHHSGQNRQQDEVKILQINQILPQFSRTQIEAALRDSSGDVDSAVVMLLSSEALPSPDQGPTAREAPPLPPSNAPRVGPPQTTPQPAPHNTPSILRQIVTQKSQFSHPQGRSACTYIAFSAAVKILNPSINSDEIRGLMEAAVDDGVGWYKLCKGNATGQEHTSPSEVVEELAAYGLLDRLQIKLVSNFHQGLVSTSGYHELFDGLIQEMRTKNQKLKSVVLTKPPETVMIQIFAPTATQGVSFHIFDSHPRPTERLEGASYVTVENLGGGLIPLLLQRLPPVTFGAADHAAYGYQLDMMNAFEAISMDIIDLSAPQQPDPRQPVPLPERQLPVVGPSDRSLVSSEASHAGPGSSLSLLSSPEDESRNPRMSIEGSAVIVSQNRPQSTSTRSVDTESSDYMMINSAGGEV